MSNTHHEVEKIEANPELSVCPRCTYSQGFHVAVVKMDDRLKLELICPSCSARYRMEGLELVTA